MKKIILLMLSIVFLFTGCDKFPTNTKTTDNEVILIKNVIPPEDINNHYYFKKEQSYELSELIKVLSPAKNSDSQQFLHTLKEHGLLIYWQNNLKIEDFPYSQSGAFGLLLNGVGQTNYWQEWEKELLINKQLSVGLPATIAICGDLYWQPLFIRIYTISPFTIANIFKTTSINNEQTLNQELFKNYFSKNSITTTLINKKSMASYQEFLYKISSDKTNDIWLAIETSQGNRTGSTTISIYYNYDDALKYSSFAGEENTLE